MDFARRLPKQEAAEVSVSGTLPYVRGCTLSSRTVPPEAGLALGGATWFYASTGDFSFVHPIGSSLPSEVSALPLSGVLANSCAATSPVALSGLRSSLAVVAEPTGDSLVVGIEVDERALLTVATDENRTNQGGWTADICSACMDGELDDCAVRDAAFGAVELGPELRESVWMRFRWDGLERVFLDARVYVGRGE